MKQTIVITALSALACIMAITLRAQAEIELTELASIYNNAEREGYSSLREAEEVCSAYKQRHFRSYFNVFCEFIEKNYAETRSRIVTNFGHEVLGYNTYSSSSSGGGSTYDEGSSRHRILWGLYSQSRSWASSHSSFRSSSYYSSTPVITPYSYSQSLNYTHTETYFAVRVFGISFGEDWVQMFPIPDQPDYGIALNAGSSPLEANAFCQSMVYAYERAECRYEAAARADGSYYFTIVSRNPFLQ